MKKKTFIIGGIAIFVLILIIGIFVIASSGGKKEVKTFSFALWVRSDTGDIGVPKGQECDGSDADYGYSDITNTSSVTVRNSITEGVITRFNLGQGESYESFCAFITTMTLTKGSDNNQGFLIEVNDGKRGSTVTTWDELVRENGIRLELGESPYSD